MKKLFSVIFLFAEVMAFAQVAHTFSAQTSDFQIETDKTYKIVNTQKTSNLTTQIGAPQLPVFSKNFVLPAGSMVTNIGINNQSELLLDGDWVADKENKGKLRDFRDTGGNFLGRES